MFEQVTGTQGGMWDDFYRLQRELDSLFGAGLGRSNIRSVAGGTFPAVNVGTTEDAVQVYIFAPGLDAQDLDLSIQRNVLTVSGSREVRGADDDSEQASAGTTRDKGYHLHERFQGSFRRVISLPEDVDSEQIDASYRDGVLLVKIAKRDSAKPRRIDVQH